MKRGLLIYGSYLGILILIILAVYLLGLNAKAALWISLLVAAIYAVFWPRW